MTEEQGNASTHSTASKRDVVFAWLDEHHEPGMTAHTAAKGAGVSFGTAEKWLGEWRRRPLMEDAPVDVDDNVDDESEGDAEQADAVDDDNVVVARAYLLTLEALRDQVLETQRLRRALEAR